MAGPQTIKKIEKNYICFQVPQGKSWNRGSLGGPPGLTSVNNNNDNNLKKTFQSNWFSPRVIFPWQPSWLDWFSSIGWMEQSSHICLAAPIIFHWRQNVDRFTTAARSSTWPPPSGNPSFKDFFNSRTGNLNRISSKSFKFQEQYCHANDSTGMKQKHVLHASKLFIHHHRGIVTVTAVKTLTKTKTRFYLKSWKAIKSDENYHHNANPSPKMKPK